jgi:hypothetical protein
MGYRRVQVGNKVKASDVQQALDQGVLQFGSDLERSNQLVGSAYTGMLSRLTDRPYLQVYHAAGEGSPAAGWIPLGGAFLGGGYCPSLPGFASGVETLFTYAADVKFNPGQAEVSIFDTNGTIHLPYRGYYMVGVIFTWSHNPDGDRVVYTKTTVGSISNYGFHDRRRAPTVVAPHLQTSVGVFGNLTNADATFQVWAAHTGGANLTISEGYVGVYLLSTVFD